MNCWPILVIMEKSTAITACFFHMCSLHVPAGWQGVDFVQADEKEIQNLQREVAQAESKLANQDRDRPSRGQTRVEN